jgi:hypothetical protein
MGSSGSSGAAASATNIFWLNARASFSFLAKTRFILTYWLVGRRGFSIPGECTLVTQIVKSKARDRDCLDARTISLFPPDHVLSVRKPFWPCYATALVIANHAFCMGSHRPASRQSWRSSRQCFLDEVRPNNVSEESLSGTGKV